MLISWLCVITEPGRVKKELSKLFSINCSVVILCNIRIIKIEINLDNVCLDLLVLIVRKHVYNYNRLIKAADHIHVGVRTCTLQYIRRVH
jgi:hypothetical protein